MYNYVEVYCEVVYTPYPPRYTENCNSIEPRYWKLTVLKQGTTLY